MARDVQWLEWGTDAFEKAKAEDKPIVLDIMARWCHWCHVMDNTTYSDPEVVAMINERFVAIRVDSDARPDINVRYNRGGWPTTAFLTPQGDLMGGSTYLPPAQMKQTLLEYSTFYQENKQAILDQARESHWNEALKAPEPEELEEAGLDSRVVERAIDEIRADADLKFGGFGHAPKFPHPEAVDLALLWYHTHRDDVILSFARLTLDAMATGGLYDHLGGGFHRYSVDNEWRVPHFEKLLDVNASMLATYANAFRMLAFPCAGSPAAGFLSIRYRQIAEGTMHFLDTVLGTPEGVFYSSQDADVRPGDDGSYFTWALDEVKGTLPEDLAAAAIAFFGISAEGDIKTAPDAVAAAAPGTPHHPTTPPSVGRNVLREKMTFEELGRVLGVSADEAKNRIQQAKHLLLEAREKRQRPKVDRKIMTSWNALAAQAYFDAYEAFGDIALQQRALMVVDFLLANCVTPEGGTWHLLREVDGNPADRNPGARKLEPALFGQLCDLAPLANACLDAYEATGNRDYMERALGLVRFADEHLRSPQGGYFDSPSRPDDLGELAVKDRSIYDNSEMAKVLARLYMFTGEIDYQGSARLALASLLPEYERAGYLATGYVLAADLLLNYPVELVTVGPIDDPRTRALHESSLRLFEPRRMVQLLDPERDRDLIEKRGYALTDRPTLFMCMNSVCAAPIHDPQQLAEVHSRFHTMAGAVG